MFPVACFLFRQGGSQGAGLARLLSPVSLGWVAERVFPVACFLFRQGGSQGAGLACFLLPVSCFDGVGVKGPGWPVSCFALAEMRGAVTRLTRPSAGV